MSKVLRLQFYLFLKKIHCVWQPLWYVGGRPKLFHLLVSAWEIVETGFLILVECLFENVQPSLGRISLSFSS